MRQEVTKRGDAVRGAIRRVLITLLMSIFPGMLAAAPPEKPPAAESAPPTGGRDFPVTATPLLEAIEELESANGATCHSAASRFEDLLFGTPLLDGARHEKIRLQQELIARVWLDASRLAAAALENTVSESRIRKQLDSILLSEMQPDGQVRVNFPGREPISIPQRRVDQYGSIAYSLRAILAVQQQFMLGNDGTTLPLSAEAIDSFRRSIDLLTLCALILADGEARERSEFEITALRLASAWSGLVPQHAATSPTSMSEGTDRHHANGLDLLDRLIDSKMAAYRAYNDWTERKAQALFVTNSVRFYARAPIAHNRSDRSRIINEVKGQLSEFAATLVAAASERASQAEFDLIRAEDAVSAVNFLLPAEIDEFEDVHVFPNLAAEKKIVLEVHDCDSFRNFGLHWSALKHAIHSVSIGTQLPDPFAAEILAETISQYGVLILRLAGNYAKAESIDVHLKPASLDAASTEIKRRTNAHRKAKPPTKEAGRTVSAASNSPSEPGAKYFTDVTAGSGIDFQHRTSRWLGEFRHKQVKTPPTFSGGGVAAEDIDGDSHIDLLFVGGGGNALYLNQGDGRFVDITTDAGIDVKRPDGWYGEARNPIIADFDNDGLQDILITYVDDDHLLFRNMGQRHFEDVSEHSGLGGAGLIAGPATVFDFDGDGLLDIYIGHFGNYLEGAIPNPNGDNQQALPNKLFRNLGGMRFKDVTQDSGTADSGWAQAVSHVDFDRDGRQDIIVANDYGRNAFLRNLGEGRFENLAPAFGMTNTFHSMNVGTADINHDGFPDIYISNLATLVKDNKYFFPDVTTPQDFDLRAMAGMSVKESDVLYLSLAKEGVLTGYEPSSNIERGATSTGWAWDAEFLDFDNDGDDDLYLVNGTNDFNAFSLIYKPMGDDGKRRQILLSHRRESNVLFVNEAGTLKNDSGRSGADFQGNSRSSSYLDMDGDGDLDIAVNNFESGATLLRNNVIGATNAEDKQSLWMKLRLIGDPSRGVNRDAVGAVVTISSTDGWQATRMIQCGSGYLSMNPKLLHFGLGSTEKVNVHISWPNGEEEMHLGMVAGSVHTITLGMKRASLTGAE